MSDAQFFLRLMPLAYVVTIALELPVLMVGLSPVHSWKRRLAAGFWLTACTYPIVFLALPLAMNIRHEPANYVMFLVVAETFAPLAECAIFAFAFHRPDTPMRQRWRDYIAITLANLVSFLLGMLIPIESWRG